MKVDPTVKKETVFIGFVTLLLSALLESVFLIIGKWDLTVLTGNLLGAAVGVANFFLLGLAVQKAVKEEESRAQQIIKSSHTVRFACMVLIIVVAVLLPQAFNMWATLISLLFATIAVYLRPLFNKVRKNREEAGAAAAQETAAEDGGDQ